MKLSWGIRIAVLYGGFVALIITLVVGSMRQDFDLVSSDYYEQEIKYQQVIDAGKNQATLSSPVLLTSDANNVTVTFPQEFKDLIVKGTIHFYSPVEAALDKELNLQVSNNMMLVSKRELHGTNYKVKISWEADGKQYFQETDITL